MARLVGEGVEMISTGGSRPTGRLRGVDGSLDGDGGKTGESAVDIEAPADIELRDGDSSGRLVDDSPLGPGAAWRARLVALELSDSERGLGEMGMGEAGRFPAVREDSRDVCRPAREDSA